MQANRQRVQPYIEGTPGVYIRRQSPPKIPATVPPPSNLKPESRSRFGSQSSCNSVSATTVLAPTVSASGNDWYAQQRTSAARRPVTRSHPNATRELSSHSFSDNSKKVETVPLKKSLTLSQSIGNVGSTRGAVGVSSEKFEPVEVVRNSSASLQNLSGRMPGSSIVLETQNTISEENELPLPPNWAIELTPDGFRYYVDHNNRRTHWIHPLAAENLPPGWTKIFDEGLGVVYYNELEHRSQFEQPGLATPASNIAQVLGSACSIAPNRSQLTEIEDLNIISEEIPVWLQMYSEAPSDSDHLLNFNLFKLQHLETFDEMLLKLFKQDAINTVIKYEKPRREINRELLRRIV
uniref:Uncharacterized protein n=1 Tax=Panagrolaimus sp. JU765 TaxID=591449 RepID=A0AC34PXR2_9BILA